jgi:glutamate-5-semialdehyde dehydrogenase
MNEIARIRPAESEANKSETNKSEANKSEANKSETLPVLMARIGRQARAASRALALADTATKQMALRAMAQAIRDRTPAILDANARDVAAAQARGTSGAMLDRLRLDASRIKAIAKAVAEIAELPDPVGRVLSRWSQPNGLVIERVATPLGVIGVIFESRPNVTADAGALCVWSGNAAVLRAGSESLASARAIAEAMQAGLAAAGLPAEGVQLVPMADRDAVGAMLAGLDGNLDVIVPRGGKSLVARVQAEARVPVFAHLEGICHVYIHGAADPAMARSIVLNAKMRRTGICGAAETLLVDQAALPLLKPLVSALLDAGCAVRGCEVTQGVDPRVTAASEEDWRTEYLDAIIAARVVPDIDAAMAHIAAYGSQHTEAIVTADAAAADRFLREVDSAIVVHNASTQFADGGEFGFGAEIGIATGRMHARGPVGAEQLCSFKYRVHGTGQTRP